MTRSTQAYSNTRSAEQHMNIQHDVIPMTSRLGTIKLLSKWYTQQFIFMNSVNWILTTAETKYCYPCTG